MIRHVWTVICESSSIDRDTNNLSLLGALESLSVRPPPDTSFPITIPFRHHVVSLWVRGDPDVPGRGVQRLRLLGPLPAREELHSSEMEVDLSEYNRMRTRAVNNGFPIGGHGEHEWEISIQMPGGDWQVAATVPVEIVVLEGVEEAAE